MGLHQISKKTFAKGEVTQNKKTCVKRYFAKDTKYIRNYNSVSKKKLKIRQKT